MAQTIPYSFDFGHLTIVFDQGNPSSCDPGEFKGETKSNYLFSETIDWQFDQNWHFVYDSLVVDSIVCFDRYSNCMAIRISETEGVIPHLSGQTERLPKSAVYRSPWHRNDSFSFSHYGYEQAYWQPHLEEINQRSFDRWYGKNHRYVSEYDNGREVFCYQRELKIIIYQMGGRKTEILLTFHHKDGTC